MKIKVFRDEFLHPHIAAQRQRRSLATIVRDESNVLAMLSHPNVARYLTEGKILKVIQVPGRMINFVISKK